MQDVGDIVPLADRHQTFDEFECKGPGHLRGDYNSRAKAAETHPLQAGTYNPIVIERGFMARAGIGIILLLGVSLSMMASELPRIAVGKAIQVDPQFGRRRNQRNPDETQAERDRLKAVNQDRQKKLKEDTDKLLQLSTELKEYVDKTNENILSINVIKKAEEIEKLAKSVREKMKTYYDDPYAPPAR
jgi:Spy/CpxP family protein refolding chaperone